MRIFIFWLTTLLVLASSTLVFGQYGDYGDNHTIYFPAGDIQLETGQSQQFQVTLINTTYTSSYFVETSSQRISEMGGQLDELSVEEVGDGQSISTFQYTFNEAGTYKIWYTWRKTDRSPRTGGIIYDEFFTYVYDFNVIDCSTGTIDAVFAGEVEIPNVDNSFTYNVYALGPDGCPYGSSLWSNFDITDNSNGRGDVSVGFADTPDCTSECIPDGGGSGCSLCRTAVANDDGPEDLPPGKNFFILS